MLFGEISGIFCVAKTVLEMAQRRYREYLQWTSLKIPRTTVWRHNQMDNNEDQSEYVIELTIKYNYINNTSRLVYITVIWLYLKSAMYHIMCHYVQYLTTCIKQINVYQHPYLVPPPVA